MKVINMIFNTIHYNKEISKSIILDILENLDIHEAHLNLDIALNTIIKLIDENADDDFDDYDMADIVMAIIEHKEIALSYIKDELESRFKNKEAVGDIVFSKIQNKKINVMNDTQNWINNL